jgi:hypothetical protein
MSTKSWIKRSLVATRVTRLARLYRQPRVADLMYHWVLAQPESEFFSLGKIMHSRVAQRQMEVRTGFCELSTGANSNDIFVSDQNRFLTIAVAVNGYECAVHCVNANG